VISHAHPSPVSSAVPQDDAECLRERLDNFVFDVELCGLAANSKASPQAMHLPRLRRSESTTNQVVNHLDVVSLWKSLSNTQALELTLWERFFKQCLTLHVEERLRFIAITQLSKCKIPVDELSLLSQLVQCYLDGHVVRIGIDIPELIDTMIEAFYEDHPGEIAARNFRWSLGSGDLPNFLYNFLCTQDCFLHTAAGPCLLVALSCYFHSYPVLTIRVDVKWQVPNIIFGALPEQLRLGESYPIALNRVQFSMGEHTSNYKSFPDQVHYVVLDSSSFFRWVPEDSCFYGQAPDGTREVRQLAFLI
jgi:hypothetical protein